MDKHYSAKVDFENKGESEGVSQERISTEQYREMVENEKTHKYGAKKTTIDGITFDSKREAEYYEGTKAIKASRNNKRFHTPT